MQGFRYDFTNKYSNQYKTITDLSPEEYAFNGYDAGALSRGDMVYDGNGNLTTEPEKGLTIAYNVLNLPAKITRQIDTESRTIDYLYGGDGTKLQRKTGDESEVTKTDYIGTFVYEDVADQSSLKYLITPAGRWNADI